MTTPTTLPIDPDGVLAEWDAVQRDIARLRDELVNDPRHLLLNSRLEEAAALEKVIKTMAHELGISWRSASWEVRTVPVKPRVTYDAGRLLRSLPSLADSPAFDLVPNVREIERMVLAGQIPSDVAAEARTETASTPQVRIVPVTS